MNLVVFVQMVVYSMCRVRLYDWILQCLILLLLLLVHSLEQHFEYSCFWYCCTRYKV